MPRPPLRLAGLLLAFTVALLIPAHAAHAAAGPIAAYSFDEGSGSTLTDLSGNGKNGTIVNATWTTAGKFGSALSFNGTNARVDLPALGTFYNSGFTFEAWVKKGGSNIDVGIVGTWDYPAGGPMLWIDHIAGHFYETLNTGLSNYVDSGQTPVAGTWQHIAATYDGTTARFYVNGVQTASKTFTGAVGSSNSWHIGAYGSTPGGFFDGVIDEVRIFDHALTATEVQSDMNERVGSDVTPPTAPTAFAKTASTSTSITTTWTASSDNLGVSGYRVYRGGSLIDTGTGTSYTFTGLVCSTSYVLGVEAFDAAGNTSTRTALTTSSAACDTTAPTVAITAPTAGASVNGTISVTATASDNDAVSGVQFKVDGANIGSEDTTAPYSVSWDAGSVSPGAHSLTAVARDPSGNTKTSVAVAITVTPPPPGSGPIASYSFDDGSGAIAGDASGHGNQGTILNGSWTTGKYGSALSFNGSSTRVDLPALGRFYKAGYTFEAWVKTDGKVDVGVVGSWDANIGSNGGPMIWIDHIVGHFYQTMASGLSSYLDSGITASTGTWQHVAATYDGATAKVYVNGVLAASKAFTGNVGDANAWRIGAYGSTPGGYFDGLIDEVRIYDRPLTATQIQADMATPLVANLAATPVTPADGATGVSAAPPVKVSFNEAMSATTINTSNFYVRDASNNLVPSTVAYDSSSGTATLSVTSALNYGGTYTVTVKGGSGGVASASGTTLASSRTWSFTVAAQPPILVITTAAQPFSSYTSEILNAEGLDAYTSLDLSLVTASILTGFDEVVLGDMALTTGQVTMLTTWVNAGGNLVAMHPDKKLASLAGLFDLGSTLSNAYLKVSTTTGTPGEGIVADTIQFHGTADRYLLNGATAVASLYTTATSSTSSPAVTLRSVGSNGGQVAVFTYDLSRSVVYTRQGNPAWVGQDRDGISPARTNDLFFGAKSGDVQPDWIDLNKVSIPQADEQQRLLVNLLTRMGSDRKPLPRFWYLPRSAKAAVVMTGDDHAFGGTAGRFDKYIAASPANCDVDDWECVRSTSNVYSNGPLTDAQAKSYIDKGFELSMHLSPAGINDLSCAGWTAANLDGMFDTQLAAFAIKYPSVPAPTTERTHCVSWSDWATFPKVELNHGIRLDTNYYYYPGSWVGTKPGFMTGSGEIMRFADADGSLIDVYQASTEITDESGQAEPSTIAALLDNAVGTAGFYGAFVANIHTDNAASTDSDAIIAAAQARGVPVVSAKQLLDWTDGRAASSFQALTWSSSTLGFRVNVGDGANGLTAMLPMQSGTKTLSTLTLTGSGSVPFTTQTIKGISYAFFTAAEGTYAAHYS